MAFNGNERLDARPGRAPCGEECQIAVAYVAPDQEATGPKPRFRLVVFVGIEVGEFAIDPVMKPCTFGAFTGRKTLPCFRIEIAGDLLRRAGDRRLPRRRTPHRQPPMKMAHKLPVHAVSYRQPALVW